MAEAKMNLMSLWTKDKDTKEKEALEQAFEELNADGAKTVAQKKGAIGRARRALQTALEGAQKKPDFQTILDAFVTYKAAQADYEMAVELASMIDGTDGPIG